VLDGEMSPDAFQTTPDPAVDGAAGGSHGTDGKVPAQGPGELRLPLRRAGTAGLWEVAEPRRGRGPERLLARCRGGGVTWRGPWPLEFIDGCWDRGLLLRDWQ